MRPVLSLLVGAGVLLTTLGTTPTLAQGPAPGPQGGAGTAPAQPAGPAQPGGPTGPGPGVAPAPPVPPLPPAAVVSLVDPRNPLLRGDAVLQQTGPALTAVTVTVYGLEPGSTHVNHIHGQSCSGPIRFPLRDLVADHAGVARSFSTVPGPINLDDWYINIHAGYALPSPGILCGKVLPVPPPPPVPAMAPPPMASSAAVPVIPEADSLALLALGLPVLGGIAGWRAWRRKASVR